MKKREWYTIIVFIIIAALDNAALGLVPAILKSVAAGLGVPEIAEAIVAFPVALVTLITAITSFFWGYYGDKYSRKKLLLYGTILWAIFIFLVTFSQNYFQFLLFVSLAGIGLGCIASVGFSIIVDFISPSRRGLAMSLWGLSQGVGSVVGYTLAVIFDVKLGWNYVFLILSVITFGFVVAYFFTIEPERGATEKELQDLFNSGKSYDYRINRGDLSKIIKNKTNRLLILQGLFAQVGYGGIVLLPVVFINKLMAQAVPETPAKLIGTLIAGLFQIGGVFSILFGWLGDKYHKRTLKARPLISGVGIILAIPVMLAMIFIPFQFSGVPNTDSFGVIVGYLGGQLISNPLFLITFMAAFIAAICTTADAPNFFAMVGDVNMPEHRGTMFGVANFMNGIGRTCGLLLCMGIQLLLVRILPLDVAWTYALGSTFLFFIPAGICYLLAVRTVPGDVKNIKKILAKRGEKEG
ncbi:MAG: MFS transporter [Candidatus Helarchaeota archaeon]|nr:MFS transporter [Candidatus Helarchaeota archaeon]